MDGRTSMKKAEIIKTHKEKTSLILDIFKKALREANLEGLNIIEIKVSLKEEDEKRSNHIKDHSKFVFKEEPDVIDFSMTKSFYMK